MALENKIIKEDLNKIINANIDWGYFSNQKILITGGSGLLGSYITKSLLVANKTKQLDLNICCLVRNRKSVKDRLGPYIDDPALKIFTADLSSTSMSEMPQSDIIIHIASQASPKYYKVDPVGTILPNVIGTHNLLRHAVSSKSKKFLFFSSGEVYGEVQTDIVAETDYGYLDPMNLRSCYAESKRLGENMCVAWASQYNLNTSVVRPYHTYGPGMYLDDGRVFADFVRNILNRESITLNSDGSAKRLFCYISDATEGFLSVLTKGKSGQAYNIANPFAEVSILELANILSNLIPGYEVSVIKEQNNNKEYFKSPISRSMASIIKANEIGWFPTTTIEDGFRRTIISYLEN
jgi:UDP-glucuronate decarboxylase